MASGERAFGVLGVRCSAFSVRRMGEWATRLSLRDAVFSTHRPPTRYTPRAMSQPPPVPPELTPPPPGKISGTGRFLGLLLVVPLFALMVLLSGCWLSVWWLVHFNIPAAARPAAVIGPMFWSLPQPAPSCDCSPVSFRFCLPSASPSPAVLPAMSREPFFFSLRFC
jgi:hypothetical protein